MNSLRRFFDGLTMYRLMLYFMLFLLGAAMLMSVLGILPYSVSKIFFQTASFVAVCWVLNTAIALLLKAKPNVESSMITGLILAAIAGPLSLPQDWLVLLIMAGAAIASKYIFAIRKSHVFNPAAFGAVIAGILGYSASWWIGNRALLPIILVGGLLVAHKIRRVHLVVCFLAVYSGLSILDAVLVRNDGLPQIAALLDTLLLSSPLVFFSVVMLAEPLTSPRTKAKRIYFGAFSGAVFFAFGWLGSQLPFSLELSLLIGNIFSRVINPDARQSLTLRKTEFFSPEIRGFWFEPVRPFVFTPGQYLEYTLAHPRADTRGVRRYFTIASAPHERWVLLATRFSEPSSSFKKALSEMKEGDEIIASKVAGEFVLPRDTQKKLVFIAGGIGSTPFRSMTKQLLRGGESRDIVFFYCAREEKDLVFRNVFEEAARIGMRNVYVLSNKETVSAGWNAGWAGRTGMLDARMLEEEVPDARERIFYVSGPEPMVNNVNVLLRSMSIPQSRILRDFFPGYAAEGTPVQP